MTKAAVNKKAKTIKKVVADGDYTMPVEPALNPVFSNPEFSKAADALIEAVRHRLCTVDGHVYDRGIIVDIARQILESRP